MSEKKYSKKVQETIDLLKSAVAEESKKASKKELDLSLNKPIWNRIKYQVEGINEVLPFNSYSEVNMENEDIAVNNNVFTKFRLSNYFKNESDNFANIKKNIIIKSNLKERIYINMELSKNNPNLVDVFNITLEENSSAKIYIIYKSIDDFKSYHNGYINIKANKGSKLELFTIQDINVKSENFLGVDIDVLENADVKYYAAEFGGLVNVTSTYSNLLENRANCLLFPVYLSDGERKTDYEYTLNFYGKECVADIDARGVTKDKAVKVFRGNLVFERFSSKSAGSEKEFSILLDKTVNAHSIPTLFCDEDDVIGAHSASIGKIDQDKLFYLMSRGFSEKEAKKLVVESSFGPLFEALDDEKLQEYVKEIIERRL